MALVGSVAGSLVAGGVSTVLINQLFSGSDHIIQVYYGFSNLIQTRYVSSAVSPSAFSSTLGTDTRIRTDQIRQEYVSLQKNQGVIPNSTFPFLTSLATGNSERLASTF